MPPDDDLRKVLRSPASHQGVQQPVLDPAGRPSRLQPRVGRQQRHRLRTVRQLPQELQVQVLVEAFGAVPFPPNTTFPINIFLSERSRPALIQSSTHSTEQPSFSIFLLTTFQADIINLKLCYSPDPTPKNNGLARFLDWIK